MKAPMVEPHILDTLTSRHRADASKYRAENAGTLPPVAIKTKKRAKKATQAAPLVSEPHLEALLKKDLARAMVRCTSFYMLDMPEDLIEQSAAFLDALGRLWAARGIDPEAVWREIDHRVQLGNLLNRLNRHTPIEAETTRKYWRPSSTKLP
ncbi:hypothetical protein AA102526_0033 [Asaia lannensis NBRC 102526]|nr:hypothetical protein AA102526_0033 [Asaia lannensis NBRC 102526]